MPAAEPSLVGIALVIDDAEKGPLALEDKGTLMLTWDPTSGAPPPPPPEGQSEAVVASGSGAGGALVKFDANAARRGEVIGNQAVRAAAALVPRAAKDALANHKTPEIESGRGFALLEKMGWKKGEGLGRTRSGTTGCLAGTTSTRPGPSSGSAAW